MPVTLGSSVLHAAEPSRISRGERACHHPRPRPGDRGGTNTLVEGMKFFLTYMKCQSWTDPGSGLICRLREHLSNSVERHDRYYENWKYGRVQTLGLDTDSRLLCSDIGGRGGLASTTQRQNLRSGGRDGLATEVGRNLGRAGYGSGATGD
jgi:hypothetical protein